ncbi:MAG TPA: hypothetical protein EYQ01_01165 [Nitrospira sp.]|nr:hypothetical protein [Candidatus Manganitrophaceae bacterium]
MYNKYRFLDSTLDSKTRDRCRENVEKIIKAEDIICPCGDLMVLVNFQGNSEPRFGAMVRCGCENLKPRVFYFSLGYRPDGEVTENQYA